jgi:hypothetical protein
MNLPAWKDRPEVTANLLNPAFCSEIIRECIKAFKNESGENLPFSLSLLILPIILTSKIRERMPKSKVNGIHYWINRNEDLKIGFAQQVRGYLPFTREAIMFGSTYKSICIDIDGNLDFVERKGKLKLENSEVKSCVQKAILLGKLFAISGSPITIYSIFGIKP